MTPVSWGCLLASRGLFVNSAHRVTGLAQSRRTCHCELWGWGSVLPARPPCPRVPGGEGEREGERVREKEESKRKRETESMKLQTIELKWCARQ